MTNDFDFIALGDIVTDAFIELNKQTAHINKDETGHSKLCLNFGDKLPYNQVEIIPAVGNSPNASVSASRLGLNSALITNLGDDMYGKEALGSLAKNKVDTRYATLHSNQKTNYHFVLRYGAERTILIKHEIYDYKLPENFTTRWLYLSSLGENSLAFHQDISNYLKTQSYIKLAFQPGTFQINLGLKPLKALYERSDLFFCNKEEARKILNLPQSEIKDLLKAMTEAGPKIAVITDGPQGAYVYDGSTMWYMPIYPDPKEPVDRTGAGDSFSSTFTSMLALGYDIPEALRLAPINSMSVVQHVGAQAGLLTLAELEAYLTKAPPDYQPTQIN